MSDSYPSNPRNPNGPPSSDNAKVGSVRVNHTPKLKTILDDENDSNNDKWMQKARDAYAFSTTYVDTNYRRRWEDSIRAFNNEHPSDSKYHSGSYDKRSRLYRPKTRSIIRKIEAAGAVAYFSNSDIVSIESENQSDPKSCAAAEIAKELIQHHLEKSIPWYQVVTGGLQDALTTGSACAHIYWETKTKTIHQETMEASQKVQPQEQAPVEFIKDCPVIDLIPIENIRIDQASSWTDPVNTSPYLIHLIPMYVGDVKTMMISGKWHRYSENVITAAVHSKNDTTTQTRTRGKQNPYNSDGKTISDYEIVWVQRHIHREYDIDYDFYTLSDVCLLTDPVPLEENVFHGKRPYVIGNCVVETHKVFPSSIPEISKGLQEEANEIANQRLDNVKYAMNKKWIVARNKQVDIQSLLRNVPGSVCMTDDVNDVREISTPDVTGSSYQEQDRINVDMDELLGNFGAGTVQNNRQLAQTASGMSMLNQSANVLVEYTLRTFTATFIEPILNQLIQLMKHYETNQTLLNVIGNKSVTFKKIQQHQGQPGPMGQPGQMGQPQGPMGQPQGPMGQPQGQPGQMGQPGPMGQPQQDQVTPQDLLQKELHCRVNVGMGATSPEQKINKLIMGMTAYTNIAKSGVPNLNISEVGKEIFGALGYADGSRFIQIGDDPVVQQLQMKIAQLAKALQDKQYPHQVKAQIATQNNQVKLAIAGAHESHANNRKLVDHFAALTHKGLGVVADAAAIKTLQQGQSGQQGKGQSQGQQGQPPQQSMNQQKPGV
jgi:hypothetical protein